MITVQWYDADGKKVLDDRKLVDRYLTNYKPTTPLEYPTEGATGKDGWTDLAGTWQAPSGAAQAVVELHGRWAARGRMEWSDVDLRQVQAPTPRLSASLRFITNREKARLRNKNEPSLAVSSKRRHARKRILSCFPRH